MPIRNRHGARGLTMPPGENEMGVAKKASNFASLLSVGGWQVTPVWALADEAPSKSDAPASVSPIRRLSVTSTKGLVRACGVATGCQDRATITSRFQLSPPYCGGRFGIAAALHECWRAVLLRTPRSYARNTLALPDRTNAGARGIHPGTSPRRGADACLTTIFGSASGRPDDRQPDDIGH